MAEAQKLALTVLKQVMEEKLSAVNIELATVTSAAGFTIATKPELEVLISTLAADVLA